MAGEFVCGATHSASLSERYHLASPAGNRATRTTLLEFVCAAMLSVCEWVLSVLAWLPRLAADGVSRGCEFLPPSGLRNQIPTRPRLCSPWPGSSAVLNQSDPEASSETSATASNPLKAPSPASSAGSDWGSRAEPHNGEPATVQVVQHVRQEPLGGFAMRSGGCVVVFEKSRGRSTVLTGKKRQDR